MIKTVRSDTVQELKDFNSQSLTTQAKKGEQVFSVMPVIHKAFDSMGDGIVDISTENEPLKNKIGSYAEKTLGETKTKLLKQIDDEKKANSNMPRMKKTDE